MPRRSEFSELFRYCKREPAVRHGVKGIKLTGPNGNVLFLPAAGENRYDFGTPESFMRREGLTGSYWTSIVGGLTEGNKTDVESSQMKAYCYSFESQLYDDQEVPSMLEEVTYRASGLSVRGVIE